MWKCFFLYSLFNRDEENKNKTNEEIEKEIELEREKFKRMRELEKDIDHSNFKFKINLLKLGMIIFVYFIFLYFSYASLGEITDYSLIDWKIKIGMFIDKVMMFLFIVTFLKIFFSSEKPNEISKIQEIMTCLIILVFSRILLHFLTMLMIN